MRLLELKYNGEFSLAEFVGDDIPPYAILSHTWGADSEEVSFKDLVGCTGKSKTGYTKIQFCREQAASDGLQYFWVDTCCIDKSSSAELAEAINSMFRWYREAAKCYVYLSDVSIHDYDKNDHFSWESSFRKSRWFTRGWTLQELIAPASVEFFSLEAKRLGDKKLLVRQIHEITGISIQALQGCPLSNFGVTERMSWAAKRKTTRKEDEAYSLLGIFDIHMPLIYGEGNKAFIRLKEEINKSSGPHSQEYVEFLNEKALMWAVEEGREAVVSRICDSGANIAYIDSRWRSLLYIAAEKGYIGIVRLLLKHGADTDLKSDLNWTPAIAAAHKGQYAVVELIRAHVIAKKHIPSSISTEYCSQVILFLDSDWGCFFLDTLNAKIQLVGEVPDGVNRHKDYYLRLGHAEMLFEEIEIHFSILHGDPFLAFTVDFGYGGTKGGQSGYIKVTIVNGKTYEVHRDPFKIANATSFENVLAGFAMEAADSRP